MCLCQRWWKKSFLILTWAGGPHFYQSIWLTTTSQESILLSCPIRVPSHLSHKAFFTCNLSLHTQQKPFSIMTFSIARPNVIKLSMMTLRVGMLNVIMLCVVIYSLLKNKLVCFNLPSAFSLSRAKIIWGNSTCLVEHTSLFFNRLLIMAPQHTA